MNKSELIAATAALLRERGIRKEVRSPVHVFHISDDEGNYKDFRVKRTEKTVIYTASDVAAVFDACMDIICDQLKKGEDITIANFGTLGLRFREARRTKRIDNGEWISIKARYVPRFAFGNRLRRCAQLYGVSVGNRAALAPSADHEDEYGEDGDI